MSATLSTRTPSLAPAGRILALATLLISFSALSLAAPAPTTSTLASPPLPYDASKLQKVKKLDHPTTLSGYFCKGYYRYWADGSLNQARLAADAQIQGMTIPKETTLWFYPGGKRIRRMWPGRDITIQGIPCNNANDVIFYPDGRLEAAFLSAPAVIQGLPLKKSGHCPVYLYESGKLKVATLASDARVAGNSYPKNTTLHFSEDGAVIKTEPLPTAWQILRDIFVRDEKTNNK